MRQGECFSEHREGGPPPSVPLRVPLPDDDAAIDRVVRGGGIKSPAALLNEMRESELAMCHSDIRERRFRHGGWSFRTVKAPILDTAGHYAWKRELACYEGQNLPDALFANNTMEIRHDASGTRFSFSALGALRTWAALDLEPVRVQQAWSKSSGRTYEGAQDVEYDYTYTTPYPGEVDTAPLGAGVSIAPDTSSLMARPSIDLASGSAKLRKPLCKCKGVGGRVPICGKSTGKAMNPFQVGESAGSRGEAPAAASSASGGPTPTTPTPTTPPPWESMTAGTHTRIRYVDPERELAAYQQSGGQPLFVDSLYLYEDDLHECGLAFLRCRVYVGETFWFAYSRYFLRIDGVMARVIDSRIFCRMGGPSALRKCVVQREISWKEGSWATFVGGLPSAGPTLSLAEANDHLANKVLPYAKKTTRETMVIEAGTDPDPVQEISPGQIKCDPSTPSHTPHAAVATVLWTQEELGCVAVCEVAAVGSCIAVCDDGARVSSFNVRTGEMQWSQASLTELLTAAAPPRTVGGDLFALGDEMGNIQVWSAVSGQCQAVIKVMSRTEEGLKGGGGLRNANRWVEHVAWDRRGERVAAAAGRCAVIANVNGGEEVGVEASFQSARGSVAGLCFVPCTHTDDMGERERLAVAAYEGVQWLVGGDGGKTNDPSTSFDSAAAATGAPPAPLTCSATAVLSIAASHDGSSVALGLLNKVVRVFDIGGQKNNPFLAEDARSICNTQRALDWIGFDAGVSVVCWSADDQWLAAAGGTALLVVPRLLPRAEPALLCRTPGVPAADGAGGSCGRFTAAAWCPGAEGAQRRLLAALEGGRRGIVHLFDVGKFDYMIPRRALPMVSLEVPGSGPATAMTFALAPSGERSGEEEEILLVVRGGQLSGLSLPLLE